MSAIQVLLLYINHCKISWYIKQYPLLGRCLLLGVSVNGELTILCFTKSLWDVCTCLAQIELLAFTNQLLG